MATLGFVLQGDDAHLLREVCQLRRESLSAFARRAVMRELARLGFLTVDETERILEEIVR